MKIISQVWSVFLLVMGEIVKAVEGRESMVELVEALREASDRMMCGIYAAVLEEKDRVIRENKELRRGWVIERRDQHKLLTPFGEVKYRRTYYRNKETGEYAYLSDQSCGIEPHERLDANLRAELVAGACEKSYRKSGAANRAAEVSGQAVKDCLDGLALPKPWREDEESKPARKAPRVLYIEADEDHVSIQRGGRKQAPLVYVHEGRYEAGKDRWALRNVRYFSCGSGGAKDELWPDVCGYVDAEYDLGRIDKVLLLGDGAAWIREGLEWFPRAVFLLDRYHVGKYVVSASHGDRKLQGEIRQAILKADRARVEALLAEARAGALTERQRAAVDRSRKYLLGNWDGISAWREHGQDTGGCSAEGHVSHVLSARLSRRPCSWSEQGLDRMARFRALKANGVCLRTHVLAERKREPLSLGREFSKELRRELAKRSGVLREVLGNVPALCGKKTFLTVALQSLRDSA